jgi:hypothetical protein
MLMSLIRITHAAEWVHGVFRTGESRTSAFHGHNDLWQSNRGLASRASCRQRCCETYELYGVWPEGDDDARGIDDNGAAGAGSGILGMALSQLRLTMVSFHGSARSGLGVRAICR